jgi:hypothetical protein
MLSVILPLTTFTTAPCTAILEPVTIGSHDAKGHKQYDAVPFGSLAEICSAKHHGRFTPERAICGALADVRYLGHCAA